MPLEEDEDEEMNKTKPSGKTQQSIALGTLPSQPRLHFSKWTLRHHGRCPPARVVAFSGLLH